MRDRLITLLGGGLSLLLVIGLLVPRPFADTEKISRPTSIDRGEFGMQGLQTWLDRNRVSTFSLRRRYQTLLSEPQLAKPGNLIITSLPHVVVAGLDELEQFYDWLSHGNHALILIAANDRPSWTALARQEDGNRFLKPLGFRVEPAQAEDESEQETPIQAKSLFELGKALDELQRNKTTLVSALGHPVSAGVDSVVTYSYSYLRKLKWTLVGTDANRVTLPLLLDKDTQEAALWEARVGEGRIWVASYPDLFGNVSLGFPDNARLFGNMVALAVPRDGQVIFDDTHFGLTDLYDPKAFFRDKRLHHTLLFIIAFWLLYLVGRTNRLAPPREKLWLPQASDFVEKMAGFFARQLDPLAVAQGLAKHFFNEVREHYKLPQNGKPTWDLLNGVASVRAHDLNALRSQIDDLNADRKPDFVRLTRTFDNIRKALL